MKHNSARGANTMNYHVLICPYFWLVLDIFVEIVVELPELWSIKSFSAPTLQHDVISNKRRKALYTECPFHTPMPRHILTYILPGGGRISPRRSQYTGCIKKKETFRNQAYC
jgi:hypothetical protein